MVVHRYEVGDRIRGNLRVFAVKRGFLGIVYLARGKLPGGGEVYRAIKTFRHEDDEVGRELFKAELTHWIQLPPHPNIVRAEEADPEKMHLVLEFVPGPNLREVAYRSPIHPRHCLRWARDIAAGLRFLHEENQFLHRDLRPANILLDTSRGLAARISDLGLGKPFDPFASSHTVVGTYTYMAPEVYEGKTDFRSDIFSFGATLYYLLAGRTAVKLSTRDLKGVEPPGGGAGGIPGELTALVMRCLEPDPSLRIQSMAEVEEGLARLEEWSVPPAAYLHCPEHDYRFRDAPDARCPFCLSQRQLRARLLQLDATLEGG